MCQTNQLRSKEYTRWLDCWCYSDNEEKIKEIVVSNGAEWVGFSKVPCCAWTSFIFKATKEQRTKIDTLFKNIVCKITPITNRKPRSAF